MLVLSRKVGQEIVIGQDVWVRVLEIRGDRVRMGITASADVPVHRDEVQRRINNAAIGDRRDKTASADQRNDDASDCENHKGCAQT